uniref:Hemolymph juvenile hormone binding protein n=1 Tax=Anopheles farauti TaxID=69004 RepID=A0A182QS71_9DIPT
MKLGLCSAVVAWTVVALVGAEQSEEVGFLLAEKRDNSLNEMLIGFLENFKQSMVCPNPALGLPVLAPFELDHFEVDVDQTGLAFKGEVNNVVVDGLNEFEIRNIDIKVLKLQLDFEFYFAAIRTKGKYKAKGKVISLFPFNRSGKFKFDVKGLAIKGSVKVGLKNDKVELRELTINPTIKSVKSDFKNVFLVPLNTFIFNRIVEGVLPGMINDNQESITQSIEENLKPAINEALGELSLQDLIDMVSGEGATEPVTC